MDYRHDIDITKERRNVFKRKKLLRQTYEKWYGLLLDGETECTQDNPIVELGTGAGFLKELYPQIICTDILPMSHLDVVCDCLQLPFKDAAVKHFVMVDVFHHVCDSRRFLQELERCLMKGGTVAMIEPANTLWARFIWKHFHHEDFLPSITDWEIKLANPLGCANTALPWVVFERDRELFKQEFPLLEIEEYYTHSAFSYLLSGGFSYRQLIPDVLNRLVFSFDSLLCRAWNQFGMFLVIKLRKKNV